MVRFFREAKVLYSIRQPTTNNKFIDAFEIKGLRIAFAITKSSGWSTNNAIIKIWNLNTDTRNSMVNFGDLVVLYAGYRDDGGEQIIYVGQTTSVIHSYSQPEIVTTLECSDGDSTFNQLKGCGSYNENIPVRQVIEDLIAKIGIPLAYFASSDNRPYPRGFNYSGSLKDALTKACFFLRLQPVITNNQLYIYPFNAANEGLTYDINENTGLQGIPERFISKRSLPYLSKDAPTDGYKASVALLPSVVPGDKVRLSSTRLGIENIPNTVFTVRHLGDTYGPEWATNLEMIRSA